MPSRTGGTVTVEIGLLLPPMPDDSKSPKVFVSYSRHSRHDETLVRPLAHLMGLGSDGIVFLDIEQLKPGDLWEEKLQLAIRQSSVFVLCWCCASKQSPAVQNEILIAVEDYRKKIVPVLFCSVSLPDDFARYNWIDLRGKIRHECQQPHLLSFEGYHSEVKLPVQSRSVLRYLHPILNWWPAILIVALIFLLRHFQAFWKDTASTGVAIALIFAIIAIYYSLRSDEAIRYSAGPRRLLSMEQSESESDFLERRVRGYFHLLKTGRIRVE